MTDMPSSPISNGPTSAASDDMIADAATPAGNNDKRRMWLGRLAILVVVVAIGWTGWWYLTQRGEIGRAHV